MGITLERNFGGAGARLESGRGGNAGRTSLFRGASGAALCAASVVLFIGVTLTPVAARADTAIGSQNGTYNLTPGGNDFSVASGVTVSSAALGSTGIYGSAASSWTLTNSGTVSGGWWGVSLLNSATLTNAGTISAIGIAAVRIVDGILVNQAGGVIQPWGTGSLEPAGVSVYGSASVTNAGTIFGKWVGALLDGGNLTNQAGGTIGGSTAGVFDQTAFGLGGTVTNAGKIVGGVIMNGGTVSNQAGGSIDGGIRFQPERGQTDGVLVNQAGATINGSGPGGIYLTAKADGTAVYSSSGSATVTNAGTISGTAASSSGVALYAGGVVTNDAGGVISGGASGVFLKAGSLTVSNAGSISGGAAGVNASGSGGGSAVDNSESGVISGGVYGVHMGARGQVTNAGTISGTGTSSSGVAFDVGGLVTNGSGGSISGTANGVLLKAVSITVTNAGTISGGLVGVNSSGFNPGSAVDNSAGAVITGGAYGVYLSASGEVTNAGTISGSKASVTFPNGGFLTLQTGSVLNGDAVGGGAFTYLNLQGHGVTNNNFVAFNLMYVDADGVWAMNGLSAIAATRVRSGDLQIGDASHAGAQLSGSVEVDSGGTLSGHGTVVGSVNNMGGTVSPGGSIGTLTINGNLTQSSMSTLAIEVSPTSNSKLVVTGKATLAGALVLVTEPGLYRKGTNYDFLTAGSITGSFSSLTATNGLLLTDSADGVLTLLTGNAGFKDSCKIKITGTCYIKNGTGRSPFQ